MRFFVKQWIMFLKSLLKLLFILISLQKNGALSMHGHTQRVTTERKRLATLLLSLSSTCVYRHVRRRRACPLLFVFLGHCARCVCVCVFFFVFFSPFVCLCLRQPPCFIWCPLMNRALVGACAYVSGLYLHVWVCSCVPFSPAVACVVITPNSNTC